MRDVGAGIIAAVENVGAKLQTGSLSEEFAFERKQLQPAHIHEVVIVVDGGVASVAVKNARIVSHQVLFLWPQVHKWLAPDLHTELTLGCDCAGRQTALDREQELVGCNLFQTERCFPLADFDVGLGNGVPVNENIRAGKRGAAG